MILASVLLLTRKARNVCFSVLDVDAPFVCYNKQKFHETWNMFWWIWTMFNKTEIYNVFYKFSGVCLHWAVLSVIFHIFFIYNWLHHITTSSSSLFFRYVFILYQPIKHPVYILLILMSLFYLTLKYFFVIWCLLSYVISFPSLSLIRGWMLKVPQYTACIID